MSIKTIPPSIIFPKAPRPGAHWKTVFVLAILGAFELLAFGYSLGLGAALSIGIILALGTYLYRQKNAVWLGISASLSSLGLLVDGSWFSLAAALPLTGAYVLARADKLPTSDLLCGVDLLRCFLFGPLDILGQSKQIKPVAALEATKKGSNEIVSRIGGILLPVGLSIVFLALFSPANPWLQGAFELAHPSQWFAFPSWLTFWIWALFFVLLQPLFHLADFQPSQQVFGPRKSFRLQYLTGSLVLFNVIFAFQTLSDLANFWPLLFEQNTVQSQIKNPGFYSSMVHEGAVSLAVAGFMVAAFVLMLMSGQRRKPFTAKVRSLIVIWLGQTLLLCLSCFARLDIYIDAFGLTWMRVIVVISTGMVVLGLTFILPRLYGKRSHAWMIRSNILMVLVVLNALGVANIDRLIAIQQIERAERIAVRTTGSTLDTYYLCQLGLGAAPILTESGRVDCMEDFRERIESNHTHWQNWTWIGHMAKSELGAR